MQLLGLDVAQSAPVGPGDTFRDLELSAADLLVEDGQVASDGLSCVDGADPVGPVLLNVSLGDM